MKEKKEDKFKSIIEEYQALICSICNRYAPNTEARKDLHQEILVNIWKSLDSFRGDSKISTWIYRVAVNTALNMNVQNLKHMKLMVDADDRSLNLLFDDSDELNLKIKQENDLEQLQVQVNLLSVIDKMLISLMLEDLSTREIADIIGLTEPNVRVKIHRIKEQLRNYFSETGNQNKTF